MRIKAKRNSQGVEFLEVTYLVKKFKGGFQVILDRVGLVRILKTKRRSYVQHIQGVNTSRISVETKKGFPEMVQVYFELRTKQNVLELPHEVQLLTPKEKRT